MLLVIAHPFKKAPTFTANQSMLAEMFYIEHLQIDVDFQALSVTFILKQKIIFRAGPTYITMNVGF